MKQFYKSIGLGLLLLAPAVLSAQTSLNCTLAATMPISGNQTLANICGYVDVANNKEYALLGAASGMIIVDVTTPTNPVQVVQIPMVNDLWKEIKVYSHYAYVTTEGSGGALQIVDLNALPSTTLSNYNYHTYTGDGAISGQLSTVHALHIDTTKGYLYLFGTNIGSQGAVILDLNSDPYNPTYVGQYGNIYVHDGYVDNDTLYAGHIYDGFFRIVDCTNKTNPVVLATQSTPTNFTHNAWLSNDHKYCFTTDENSNSYLASYDVSNPANIIELDRIQSQNPNSGSIVHNTHILDNWAVTSWYRDGFTIVDVTRPHNLVTVGYYDTYNGSGNGFDGAWGVYPYLPSGTIVVSNINEGLFVINPTYVRACYLEGNVTDSLCGTPLSGVTVTISSVNVTDVSNITGDFATGTAIPGTYNVTFSKPGYQSKTYNNLTFAAAQVIMLNVQLSILNAVGLTGQVIDAQTTSGLNNLSVLYDGANDYTFVTSGNGNYSTCGIPGGTYTVTAGAWGYITQCAQETLSISNSNIITQLQGGWYDDFTFDFNWTVSSTSSSGIWERGVPIGTTQNNTPSNPGVDVATDCSNQCYVTGNGGGNASQDDIDNGSTTLTSPVFDLTAYVNPQLEYDRWFFNGGGSGNPNDSLIIRLSNGTTSVVLETVTANSVGNSSWVHKTYSVNTLITPTATMQLTAYAADAAPGHLVEAGLDRFSISNTVDVTEATAAANDMQVFPNPFDGTVNITYNVTANANTALQLRDVTGRVIGYYPLQNNAGKASISPEVAPGVYFLELLSGNEVIKNVKVIRSK